MTINDKHVHDDSKIAQHCHPLATHAFCDFAVSLVSWIPPVWLSLGVGCRSDWGCTGYVSIHYQTLSALHLLAFTPSATFFRPPVPVTKPSSICSSKDLCCFKCLSSKQSLIVPGFDALSHHFGTAAPQGSGLFAAAVCFLSALT